ncbi:PQQ-binding-like beta-propeller repeat protein [Streptomyces sp. ET3-23]|uniref:serine/threonine-protein kinase n=1 Tax=Streptomyces sp. ET3-23 TaxID=2885643 RepID=UPI001D0FD987|nr:serine/threonine-protein kinase [Streptomyces sp. ET3-23]MCC2274556.1 PQQ-binding-like beta-propeller repeat protein [Streptomyces sp. ET3-23]
MRPEADDPEYAGRYRLESRLGSGGMGVVHLARSASGRRLAVKVVHAEYAVDPEFRARFRQEVAAARRVSGAFTASVVDADPDSERPWMATVFIPGPTLAHQVKRNGPLEPGELRRLAAGLAEALRDIHRAGVVHRDLKPSNVLLADDGPKVIDFGISRPYDSELRTETGKLIGTPPFMAPEQFQRPREVGPAADVFALASLLVFAATGRGPFESDSPYIVAYQVVHDDPDLTGVPDDLVPLIRDCLAKEPAERPTPDVLMARLSRPVPAGEAATTPAPAPVRVPMTAQPVPEPSSTSRRGLRKQWIAAAVVAIVALTASGTWLLSEEIDKFDESDRSQQSQPHAAGSSWQPWETVVPDGGAAQAGEVRAGFCTYGDGALYCAARGVHAARVEVTGGKVAWRRAAVTSLPGRGAPSAPHVSGGLVHALSPDKRELSALDPRTGEPRWTRDVSAYGGRIFYAGDTVLLVGAGGTVTAVDGATNKERWSHGLPDGIKPVFSFYGNGPAYAVAPAPDGRRTRVVAVDPVTGRTLWDWSGMGNLSTVGTGPEDAVFFTEYDAEQRATSVVRYEPGGAREVRVPLPTRLQVTSSVSQGDQVYLLSADGGLTAVGTEQGGGSRQWGRLWRLETSVSNASQLVAADNNRLYFSAADGRLLAVDSSEGSLLGQTGPRPGRAAGGLVDMVPSPVVAEGKVFGTAPDGTVFAVDGLDPAGWR